MVLEIRGNGRVGRIPRRSSMGSRRHCNMSEMAGIDLVNLLI